jgi:hypothetical protein
MVRARNCGSTPPELIYPLSLQVSKHRGAYTLLSYINTNQNFFLDANNMFPDGEKHSEHKVFSQMVKSIPNTCLVLDELFSALCIMCFHQTVKSVQNTKCSEHVSRWQKNVQNTWFILDEVFSALCITCFQMVKSVQNTKCSEHVSRW